MLEIMYVQNFWFLLKNLTYASFLLVNCIVRKIYVKRTFHVELFENPACYAFSNNNQTSIFTVKPRITRARTFR